MRESVTLREVEEFIRKKDTFTETQLIRTLNLSREAASKTLKDLLDLGVIRLLDEHGSRKYYTRASISRPLTSPDRIEERQMGFLREIARDPREMAKLLGASGYEEYVQKISALLDRATDNPTVKLSIIYALERKLVKEIRNRKRLG